MKKIFAFAFMTVASLPCLMAQDYMNVFHTYKGVNWKTPVTTQTMSHLDFSDEWETLNIYMSRQDGAVTSVPLSVADIDSVCWADKMTDDVKGHNNYKVFTMHIFTEGMVGIYDKDNWANCVISIDGKGEYSDYCGTARVKGRGNSSWEWYEKKPYKFKLDTKSKILGLSKAKDWNLLANYRDVTDLMNTFAFEVARVMEMPNTNHTRYVEVFLDGEYVGVYQLTEKIEVEKNRVNIDENEGVMLSFDQDDGPSLSPDATNNFWSSVYNLPLCVKYPKDPTKECVDSIRKEFAKLESAIKSLDYEKVKSMLDVNSFIGLLQMHEYLYNVEIDAPRSIYMYKDKDGKFVFGPVWDWDAGYDFDWSNMYAGHTFFSDHTELIYGTNPVRQNGQYKISKFFIDLFNVRDFVEDYKSRWSELSDSIFTKPWTETMLYVKELSKGAYGREIERWPITETESYWWENGETKVFDVDEEIENMKEWLEDRKNYLDEIIASYPVPKGNGIRDTVMVGSFDVNVTCSFSKGYSQSGKINISRAKLKEYMGEYDEENLTLVPVNSNGMEGENTAADEYGAWYDENGDTAPWGRGHVYIESNDLFSWSYGCHPANCAKGDSHVVRMRYVNDDGDVVRVADVYVRFAVQ